METKHYELYMIAVPTDGSQLQEDMYTFIDKHSRIDPPIFVLGVGLGENETTADLYKLMENIIKEGHKYVKLQTK